MIEVQKNKWGKLKMSTNEEYLKVEKISDFLSYVVHQSIKLAICARIDIYRYNIIIVNTRHNKW